VMRSEGCWKCGNKTSKMEGSDKWGVKWSAVK